MKETPHAADPTLSQKSAGWGEGAAGEVTAAAPRRRKDGSGLGTDRERQGATPMAQARDGRCPRWWWHQGLSWVTGYLTIEG